MESQVSNKCKQSEEGTGKTLRKSSKSMKGPPGPRSMPLQDRGGEKRCNDRQETRSSKPFAK